MKNFSIIEADIIKLREKIKIYESEHTGSPYIFMNYETLELATKEVGINIKPIEELHMTLYKQKVNIHFEGYKVFINNDLAFGEVEIR